MKNRMCDMFGIEAPIFAATTEDAVLPPIHG